MRQKNPNEILDKAASFDDRRKTSLYLSAGIYQRLQTICENRNAPISKVLESIIEDFLKKIEKPNKPKSGRS